VLKDIENSLEVLNEGGMIFCHDMLPTTEEIQRVPRPMPEDVWTGDCWKAWAILRATRKDLEMFIVNSDWGVGVIKKGQQEIVPDLLMDYEHYDWDFYSNNKKDFNIVLAKDF
jgi:hypothetical protein